MRMSTVSNKKTKELIAFYKEKKSEIKKRLKEFKGRNKDLFKELCFCLLTPQSRAVNCDMAIKELEKHNLLSRGSAEKIAVILRRFTRFHNKKACFLVNARHIFRKSKLDFNNSFKTRAWLVENIKGLGYKEASHFLRNIGCGKNVSILDRHILENLKTLGIIQKIPPTLTKRHYLDMENKMRAFAGKIGIPLEELDLLFWSRQTGFIFK